MKSFTRKFIKLKTLNNYQLFAVTERISQTNKHDVINSKLRHNYLTRINVLKALRKHGKPKMRWV